MTLFSALSKIACFLVKDHYSPSMSKITCQKSLLLSLSKTTWSLVKDHLYPCQRSLGCSSKITTCLLVKYHLVTCQRSLASLSKITNCLLVKDLLVHLYDRLCKKVQRNSCRLKSFDYVSSYSVTVVECRATTANPSFRIPTKMYLLLQSFCHGSNILK